MPIGMTHHTPVTLAVRKARPGVETEPVGGWLHERGWGPLVGPTSIMLHKAMVEIILDTSLVDRRTWSPLELGGWIGAPSKVPTTLRRLHNFGLVTVTAPTDVEIAVRPNVWTVEVPMFVHYLSDAQLRRLPTEVFVRARTMAMLAG
jgi:hypothetical protein